MMIRKKSFLLIVAVALLALTGNALAESMTFGRSEEVVDAEFDSLLDSVDTDFSDFHEFERYLQTTETTRCNFWCKLRQSLGLTIVGLLLICFR